MVDYAKTKKGSSKPGLLVPPVYYSENTFYVYLDAINLPPHDNFAICCEIENTGYSRYNKHCLGFTTATSKNLGINSVG